MQNSNNLIPKAKNLINTLEEKSENYTLVEIDSRIYAILAKDVLEITKVLELDHFNGMPSYVLGLANYMSHPVNVIDLREVFKIERVTYNLSAKIIFFKTGDSVSSIICDKVLDIKKLQQDKIHPLPYQQGVNFFDGLYINQEENIYILNTNNIINYLKTRADKFQSSDEANNFIINDEKSKQILKERRNFATKTNSLVPTKAPLYDMGVSFLINNVKYYINMAHVKEFFKVNNSKFIKIPYSKSYILGLVNIKGDYITVIDIRGLQGYSKTEIKEKSTIIILNSQEFKIGILADEICESLNIDFEKILSNKIQKQEDLKAPEFVLDGEIYQIVDTEKLLKDDRIMIC